MDQILLHGDTVIFFSVHSAVVKYKAKILPFGVNCRLLLAAWSREKREEGTN